MTAVDRREAVDYTEAMIEEELDNNKGATGQHHMEGDLEVNKIAFDNKDKDYRWVKVIGQGTFGTVFQCYHIKSLETVAIKKVYQDPKCRNREFSITVELNHINVIRIHTYFFTRHEDNEQEIYLNIVMDFIPTTLHKILKYYHKMGKQFPPMLSKVLTYQLLRALAYIKGLKILHRDVKPTNLLVDTKDYRLVLCDFGTSKKFDPVEDSVAYICSRYYRSPELILGSKNYGCEIDVWAAGCVIGEMLLGEPLFCGNNNKEQFLRIVHILGPPSKDDLHSMGYNYQINIPKFNCIGLKRKLGPHEDPLIVDLMSKMLTYNPKNRINPFEALTHPYFDELRKHRLLINNRSVVDLFNFSPEEIGEDAQLLTKLVPAWYSSDN
jgi:serine/threonine protein kinase